jgi:hypothetical protein
LTQTCQAQIAVYTVQLYLNRPSQYLHHGSHLREPGVAGSGVPSL